jgi:hypothetical protein
MAQRGGEFMMDGERTVAWTMDGESDGRPVVVLAHGAGAPMTHPFMEGTCQGLLERDMCVVRFHFPYMERMVREDRRLPPDRSPVLLGAWEGVLERTDVGGGPLVLAGKSMGGRMASMLLAEGRAPATVVGAVYLGYPLHPPGRPEEIRSDHLGDVGVPQLFISGSKDRLCDLDLLRQALAPLGDRAETWIVEGANHSLAVNRREPMAGAHEWLDAAAEFIRRVYGPG